MDEALEDVCDDDEKVWRERIALTETAPTSDPTPRNAVEHHSSLPTDEDRGDPRAPASIKAASCKDLVKARPFH